MTEPLRFRLSHVHGNATEHSGLENPLNPLVAARVEDAIRRI